MNSNAIGMSHISSVGPVNCGETILKGPLNSKLIRPKNISGLPNEILCLLLF